jgi:hypothetical protein
MVLSRVRFSPGFLQEQDFTESNLITADNVGKKRFFADPTWLIFPLKKQIWGVF